MRPFASRVAGIPCKIDVLYYSPSTPNFISGPPERCYEGDEEEFDFRVLDQRGRPAPWLERKLTYHDTERILAQYLRINPTGDF